MTESTPNPPAPGGDAEQSPSEGGVGDALRTAVERTMQATAGSASSTRERAGELVDDVVRRGREARDELARRSQEAGAELARRGQGATGEVGRRLEQLEERLAELERRLAESRSRPAAGEGTEARSKVEPEQATDEHSEPEVEG